MQASQCFVAGRAGNRVIRYSEEPETLIIGVRNTKSAKSVLEMSIEKQVGRVAAVPSFACRHLGARRAENLEYGD